MKISSRVFRRVEGKGPWIVRIKYVDPISGKDRYIERHKNSHKEAIDERNKQINDLNRSHGQSPTGEKMKLDDLAGVCRKTIHKPAVIINGRKEDGVKAYGTIQHHVKNLIVFFGNRPIRKITKDSLTAYKIQRLTAKRPVTVTTVNRELATLKTMLKVAATEGWILIDPFFNARAIDKSAEIERTRILTVEEESRLLAALEGTYEQNYTYKNKEVTVTYTQDYPHLKAIIIFALDTAMRLGEILKLEWKDIDFDENTIRVLATNTKTQTERIVPLSERAKRQLEIMRELYLGERPFPFVSIQRGFTSAKKRAKIKGLQFRDLRRTAITRWIAQGTVLPFAGKVGGHTQWQTTMKHYTGVEDKELKKITDRMNDFNAQMKQAPAPEEIKPVEAETLDLFLGSHSFKVNKDDQDAIYALQELHDKYGDYAEN
jgi:integrase